MAATTITQVFTLNQTVPDNDAIGVADFRNVTTSAIYKITDVQVELVFANGWNGDLFVSLSHSGGYAVLLNRVGRSEEHPDGAGSSGMTVNLTDAAEFDIHTALPLTGDNVTGVYQPDGRQTDPLTVADTDDRTALLSVFDGLDPNGTWTLFVADQGAGSESDLVSWSLTIQGVPEASTSLLLMLTSAILIGRRSRAA